MKLETERLAMRPWRESDRPVFHRLNREDTIMEFFPFRRTPEQADAVMDLLNARIAEHGFGFAALVRRHEGDCIGICGLSRTDLEPFFPDGSVEIGWRLLPETWGKGYVTEAGKRLLAFAFEELKLAEVVSFAVHNNHRSLAVMQRLGMQPDPARNFDHPGVPDTHPHLKRHVCHAISRQQWQNTAQKDSI
ncbi:GNAT family N-acetyltransferase [Salaquimonas pukyongi]|uniref:GNAT family N-acetyltransferase n=1 Tax=Salaquimonas pukyongi TaxID=2712698 RepID=UPI00096B76D4|nr:GNAT family N-acetyltransferase [Salaquimonas pukyongi]